MAVLSRWPISELFYEQPPAGWFHGLAVKMQTPFGNIHLLNIHLRPPASGNGGLSYLNYFRLGKIHPQEMTHLYSRLSGIDSSAPMIVLGDFNEADDGNAMKYLMEKGFTDPLPAFDRSSNTWHGRVMGISLSERCDHILISPQFRSPDAAVLKEGVSDHLPVVVVLEKKQS